MRKVISLYRFECGITAFVILLFLFDAIALASLGTFAGAAAIAVAVQFKLRPGSGEYIARRFLITMSLFTLGFVSLAGSAAIYGHDQRVLIGGAFITVLAYTLLMLAMGESLLTDTAPPYNSRFVPAALKPNKDFQSIRCLHCGYEGDRQISDKDPDACPDCGAIAQRFEAKYFMHEENLGR